MKEHRRIERMVALIADEARRLAAESTAEPNVEFIGTARRFMREYADQCHHGKEEDILFRELQKRDISDHHQAVLDRLVSDHQRARELGTRLEVASDRWSGGERFSRGEIVTVLQNLADLYPDHINTEDNDFFLPVMAYFTPDEQQQMIEEMWGFDHELFARAYEAQIARFAQGSQAGSQSALA